MLDFNSFMRLSVRVIHKLVSVAHMKSSHQGERYIIG